MGTRLVQFTTADGRKRTAILHDETATDPDKFKVWAAWNAYPGNTPPPKPDDKRR